MKEWREVTFMSTMAISRRWTYPNTFFRFQKRAISKFPEVQLNFYQARALRALGLLLADGTPTVGGGKTFWAVSQIFLRKQL